MCGKIGKQLPVIGLSLIGIGFTSCGESGKKPVEEKSTKPKTELADQKEKTAPEEETFDILKALILEESEGVKKKTIDYKNHSVSFPNDGDPYEVSFHITAQEDLNNDGVTDYIVSRVSEGMLGGNVNSNASTLYLIMGPNQQILQRHEILTYAPFSYNVLEDEQFKNGKLKAKATQNYRTYMPEDGQELQSTKLSFVYTNGNVYEESYLTDCALAKWKNKQLFTGSEVKRTIDMHNYTELVYEKFTSKEMDVAAEYSGCDNLSLRLETTVPFRSKDKKAIIEKRKSFLEFLKKHTILYEELELIRNYYLEHEHTDEAVELDHLSFRFSTSREKGKMRLLLFIEQTKNPNQSENWEITTRAN